eukprot:scaffold168608_cov71-Attheya_sp.AAC.1
METYELSNITLSTSAEDVEVRIKDSISMSTEELVRELLTDVCGHKKCQASASTCIIIEEDSRLYSAFHQQRPDLLP